MNPFKCYGILWNDNYSFAKDFLNDINSNFKLENLYFMNINDITYDFVKQIYPELLPDEYAKYKADMLATHDCVNVVVFCFSVPNPQFKYNPEEFQEYCVQVKQLKTALRRKYVPQIMNYEHDILAHFADNENESNLIRNALNKNKSRIVKILGAKNPNKDSINER